MREIWSELHRRFARHACGEARRLANLALCAALTDRLDLANPAHSLKTLARQPVRVPALTARNWQQALQPLVEMEPGLPDADEVDEWVAAFQESGADRKSLGAYATPRGFADAMARSALPDGDARMAIRVVDPACGAGALLIAALDEIQPRRSPARRSAALRLHGMELDPEARELTCLLIWIAAGADLPDLDAISANIRIGNALTHDWLTERPYDVLVMNPPWESLRHPGSSTDTGGAARRATIERLSEQRPGAHGLPPLYSAQGRGDRNLFKAFMELCPHLLTEGGRMAALVPAAFASDDGMSMLRRRYLSQFELERWTGFENRARHFAIDGRYKFGILSGARSANGTASLALRSFATEPEETDAPHVTVTRRDLETIGGAVGIIPDITSKAELKTLKRMLSAGVPFFEEGELGMVRYRREVDLTVGKAQGLFIPIGTGQARWNADGTMTVGRARRQVPVVEGRMVGNYDCFQKSWVSGAGRSAVWRDNGQEPIESCRPQYMAPEDDRGRHRLAICDVTSNTNTRTVLATIVPDGWLCGNTAPVLTFDSDVAMLAGLAVLNSMTFDWLARRMVSGLHLNKFYLASLAWPHLGSDDIAWLATAAKRLAAAAPRSTIIKDAELERCELELKSGIEAKVAGGFGLGKTDLRSMLSDDRGDRRGFWRFFDANPRELEVARRAVQTV